MYYINKLAYYIIIILIIILSINFFLPRAIPGDPLAHLAEDARNVSNVTESDFEAHPVVSKTQMDWGMMPYLDQPETFIATIYTFNVTSDLLKRLELAGVDPYVELGLAEPTAVRGDFNGGVRSHPLTHCSCYQVAAGR